MADFKAKILECHFGGMYLEIDGREVGVQFIGKFTMDYLENGNIRNSVNYPACDMGVKKTACRVAVLHMNIPNMIGQITGVLAAGKINISDMTNKSRDKFAYTLMDLEHTPDDIMVQKLNAIEGVLRVRLI